MSVMVRSKQYRFNSKVGTNKFSNKKVLYEKNDYNEDDSIEFRNEEDRKAEAMKNVLNRQMEPFRDEQERLHKNGVQKDDLSDLTNYKLSFEISKIDTR